MATDLQQQPPKESESELPRFLSISIFALVGLGLLTIAALFVDSVENRGSRIFLTFLVFAGFVGLTAFDTLRSSKRSWYAPAALVSNFFFLGASVLTIWLSPGNPWGFATSVFALIVSFAIVLRLGLLFGMFAMSSMDRENQGGRHVETYERKASIWSAWLGSAAAVLFVIYIAAHHILSGRGYELMTFWNIYLKLSTAVLILAGIAVSIALLLRWFFGADERALKRAEYAGQAHLRSGWEAQNSGGYGVNQWPAPQNQTPAWPAPRAATPLDAQQNQSLLPWPTFDDGRPFPAGADGQPDFEAAKRDAAPAPSNSGDTEWASELRVAPEAPAQQEAPKVPEAPQPWIQPAARNSDGWQQPQRSDGWHGEDDYPKQ